MKLGLNLTAIAFLFGTLQVATAAPNLTPYQPSGWSDKIVVARSTGTTVDSTNLLTTDSLYINWAVLNSGTTSASNFYVALYVDNTLVTSWFDFLDPNFYEYVNDYSIGSLTAGAHSITIVADSTGVVTESNENDNTYTKNITVSSPPRPNLTPYQPAGWSDKIVVSKSLGSTTDAATITPIDTLYVDWAVINNGKASVTNTFYTYLYIDGVYQTSWYSSPPLLESNYVSVQGYNIGQLSTGTHTISITTDATGAVAETNGSDNSYTKTIAVTNPWKSVKAAPGPVNLMILLSDGTIMCASNDDSATIGNAWYRLTPDSTGSYENGTWTTMAAMHDTRLFYSSQVLKDGRVFVAGGEYGTGKSTAEIYDPVKNVWTQIPVPLSLIDPSQSSPALANGNQMFSDSGSEILPNGNVLIAPVGPNTWGGTLIYSLGSNAWSVGPLLYQTGYQDEASWVKLPDSSILSVDPGATTCERYIPSLSQWIQDRPVPITLYDTNQEIGPASLLPDGRAFFVGASGHTAFYSPSGTTNKGSWTVGPDTPSGLIAADAPAAMMPNGKILYAFSSAYSQPPTYFYEFDPTANSFSQVPAPNGTSSDNISSYGAFMLDLPDGNVLYSHFGSDLYVYHPIGSPLPNAKPAISNITQSVDGSYHLVGTNLNGICEGAVYGDDAQMNSNYPLVRLTDGAGNVHYLRTYNWSSTGVRTGSLLVSTEFTNSAALPAGNYSLAVVANGVSSDPVPFFLSTNLFQPTLSFARTGNNIVLSWTTNAPSFVLQSVTNVIATNWTFVSPSPVISGNQFVVTNPMSATAKFFRLKQ